MQDFHSQKVETIYTYFKTSRKGLTTTEVSERLLKYGNHKLKEARKKSFIARFFSQFKDVMIIILLISAALSLFFGILSDEGFSEYLDAIIIFAIVILNATLGVIQESKAENAIESLKKMSQPYSKVIREGKEVFVKTTDIVVGDIIVLEAGDIVPADIRLIESASLKCDESMLTGESIPVEKDADCVLPIKTVLGDKKNMCFSSSIVTYGRGMGVVISTGQNAEIGKIAGLINNEKDEETTTLQRSLNKFGKIITIIVLCIALLIFIIDILFTKQHWTESLMTAVAIAVAAIPESLMVVVTIILSIGVTKLAKKNVIIKRLHSVETLGCCEVICSDKTGTITQNKMTVRKVYYNHAEFERNKVNKEDCSYLLLNMVLCNDAKYQDKIYIGDPTETALLEFTNKFGYKKQTIEKQFKRVNEKPFDSNRKLMTTLNLTNDKFIQFTKGGIDEILSRCDKILINGEVRKINKNDVSKIKQANTSLCSEALRVLGCAYRECEHKQDIKEDNLIFIGMLGMIDPPREEVYEALNRCKNAGMKAVMITGDHKETAYAIAKELGLAEKYSEVVDGVYLDKFTDEELIHEIQKFKVFTRVSPEHKVRIVKAYKALGKVVAMTGDGVNDAPSIKSADIGIGMGKSGTEVTKEVADMILTDDNFATVVIAVEEGRKIYCNIQKTLQFLLSCNIAEVIAILLITLIFPGDTFLVAVQILFINLVTDTLPAISLGMEAVEKDVMEHKPRKQSESIISGRIGFNILYQGILQALLVVGVYVLAKELYGSAIASTMGFLVLNLIQIVHMFSVRTNYSVFKSNPLKNKMILVTCFVGFGLLLLIALIPIIAGIFHLKGLNLTQWLIVAGFSISIVPIVEIVKLFQKIKAKK